MLHSWTTKQCLPVWISTSDGLMAILIWLIGFPWRVLLCPTACGRFSCYEFDDVVWSIDGVVTVSPLSISCILKTLHRRMRYLIPLLFFLPHQSYLFFCIYLRKCSSVMWISRCIYLSDFSHLYSSIALLFTQTF